MLEKLKSRKIHFIGIGGIGMSGIAEVLLDLGYKISGSDLSESSVTKNLSKKGAHIFKGHSASQVEGAEVVVYSSAIDPSNPEFAKAKELNIPSIKRGEMLAELMRLKSGIAIAGSHGKTTTTSIIATIFLETKLDPTYIIGGTVSNLGGNARHGEGEYLIAEADESDGSFLHLEPVMAAVTNIDNDHLDHYGSKQKIIEAFVHFVDKLPPYGKVVMNADDSSSLEIKNRISREALWYSLKGAADYVASEIKYSAAGTEFTVSFQGKSREKFQTQLIGKHNVSNALAAIAICHQSGIKWDLIRNGLIKFRGVGRRLEKIYEDGEFLVLDDYGHHPTEICATISALKSVDKRKLTVVFEPHRYSRTQNFWKEFKECFTGADEVYITPIYPASEKPIAGIDSRTLVNEMITGNKNVHFMKSLDDMKELMDRQKKQSGIFLTLGAGAISKKARELVTDL